MKKAILWTVACTLAIIATIVGGWTATSVGWIMIVLAVICAALQWLVWFKIKK